MNAGVDGLTQRLSNMRHFVQQQITTLTAKQARTSQRRLAVKAPHASMVTARSLAC